jgi:hypothetical protein
LYSGGDNHIVDTAFGGKLAVVALLDNRMHHKAGRKASRKTKTVFRFTHCVGRAEVDKQKKKKRKQKKNKKKANKSCQAEFFPFFFFFFFFFFFVFVQFWDCHSVVVTIENVPRNACFDDFKYSSASSRSMPPTNQGWPRSNSTAKRKQSPMQVNQLQFKTTTRMSKNLKFRSSENALKIDLLCVCVCFFFFFFQTGLWEQS